MDFKNYVKLPGSERQPVKGATKGAAADPNQVIQATLVLRPRQSGSNAEPLDMIARGGRVCSRTSSDIRQERLIQAGFPCSSKNNNRNRDCRWSRWAWPSRGTAA